MEKSHTSSSPSITIHRGTHQIGGVVTEISDGKSKVFIDIGANLPEADFETAELPPIDGLTVGNGENSELFLTHYHGDHVGNIHLVMPGVSMFMGKTAKALHLGLLKRMRKENISIFDGVETFEPLDKLVVGDIVVTPLMVDHSAFDAYMFVIEVGGKRILHTGDFRTHGFRGGKTSKMLQVYAKNIDYIICEGTTLSRINEKVMTESELQRKAIKIMDGAKYTFVLASSTNIDRIAAFYHAAHKADRIFVCDNYQKQQLEIVRENHKDKSSFYDFGKIYDVDAIERVPEKLQQLMEKGFCMMVRTGDKFKPYLERFSNDRAIVYSMWSGYLKGKTASASIVDFLKPYDFTELHTSGHATADALRELYETVKPTCGVIPMHTIFPKMFEKIIPNDKIVYLNDGERFNI